MSQQVDFKGKKISSDNAPCPLSLEVSGNDK